MARADIAALLALGAAFFIAVGDVIQQRSTHDVGDEPANHLALLLRLLRDPRWWLGGISAVGGFGLQAAALGLGSVLMVQALLVTSLLFALPINARLSRRRVTRWEWLWAVLLAGGVAVIVTIGNPTEGQARGSWETWAAVLAVLGPLLVACAVGARVFGGAVGAVLLALVAGSLWGVFSVLTKAVVERLDEGVWAVLSTPELYALGVVTVAGTAYQQAAFRAGALAASLPAMTVAEPVVAATLGIVLLGETMRPGEAGWLTLVGAAAAIVLATGALARGEAAEPAASGR